MLEITNNKYHLALSEARDSSQAGGKAANLARSIQIGFPVPEGFVLARETLGLFLEANELKPKVQALLEGYDQMGWRERLKGFEALRSGVLKLPIPPAVRLEAESAVEQLLDISPSGLAVRSSGICEDLEKASFAGIYESFLGITDLDPFWQSVLHCWCSTWSPRSEAYAKKMGIALPMDGMAVLVQKVIPADRAGVIFTADPVTGNPWRFVINSTFGLAGKVVDGSAPADRFVLEWDTGQILEKRSEKKPTALVFQDGAVREIAVPETQQPIASLSNEQVNSVGQLALALDRAFDRRMDLEWAMVGDQLYLLQARPLTALPPFFPHELSSEEAEEIWTPYLNTYGTLNPRERLIAPLAQDRWMGKLWRQHLEPGDIFPRFIGLERDFNGYRYATDRKWSGSPSSYDRQGTEGWLDENEARLRQGWLAQLERVHQFNYRLDQAMVQDHSAAEWVRLALACIHAEREMQAAVWYAAQWLVLNCDGLLQSFFDEVMPDSPVQGLPGSLLLGLPCYSVERSMAAQDLGCGVQEKFVHETFARLPLREVIQFLLTQHPGCRFLRDFIAFCRTYGLEVPYPGVEKQHSVLDLDGLLLVIKTSLLHQADGAVSENIAVARDLLAAGARQRQATEAQVQAYLRDRRPDQLERFNKLLDWAQFWTPALDDRKWHCSLTTRGEELIRRTGEALVRENLIDHPEHFSLLTREQWASYVQHPDAEALRAQYRQNLHEYERNRRLEPLPYLGKPPKPAGAEEADASRAELATPMLPAKPVQNDQTVFQGEGIAPGKARGVAYKVTSLDDPAALDYLTNEHILICRRDGFNEQWRRDWYSMFLVVRGLVTVQGDQLHHATQIARECGVPFINLLDADFDRLPDRVEIEIDGRVGKMIVL